ncbi:MerR family transcriptional regulator [Kitasatospora sp. LaBMicrA B282]|uniref:MerR family transcriptional regulator n=1 Tax=Kitasatospora sp. LaBMicrA B282 TaxID=3420949 RepID=UPI003D14F778
MSAVPAQQLPAQQVPARPSPVRESPARQSPVRESPTEQVTAVEPARRPVDRVREACEAGPGEAPATPGGSSLRHAISEVAARTGLTTHTLRWYERIGLLDPVDRSHAGRRLYSDDDLARLAFLGRLRLTGMPVADMLRYVELVREGDHTIEGRRELLVAHREEVRQKIADLHATLAVLDYKIDRYSGKKAQSQ